MHKKCSWVAQWKRSALITQRSRVRISPQPFVAGIVQRLVRQSHKLEREPTSILGPAIVDLGSSSNAKTFGLHAKKWGFKSLRVHLEEEK